MACARYLDWTKNQERVQKDIQSLRRDNFLLADQKNWETDRTRDWTKPQGRPSTSSENKSNNKLKWICSDSPFRDELFLYDGGSVNSSRIRLGTAWVFGENAYKHFVLYKHFCLGLGLQRVLALCDFWTWEKVELAKFCISQISGFCNFIALYFITSISWLMHFFVYLLH